MVLMWALELTLFAVVMFSLMRASTSAGVDDAASVTAESALTAACVVAASAVVRITSGVASARAAAVTTAKRVRVDDMGVLHQSSVKLTSVEFSALETSSIAYSFLR